MENCVGGLGHDAELVNRVGVFARDVELMNFVGVLRAEMVALVLTPTDQMQQPIFFFIKQTGQGCVCIWSQNHQIE